VRFSDLVTFSSTQLRRNRGRSALTATGVTVGVFALTTIVALGRGLEKAIVSQLTDDESQTRIVVRAGFGPMPNRAVDVVEGVDDPVKVDRIRKAIAKRKRGGPGGMRRKLLTPVALDDFRAREGVLSVRPFLVDRFGLALGEHELDGALSYGVIPGDPRWEERVILGQPLEDTRGGVWLHEYLLYTWGYRSDAEQAALIGETVTLTRPRETGAVSAMLSAAQAQGLAVPSEIDVASADRMLKAFAGRNGAQGEDAPELALELEIRGVIRERVEEDGFEVWDDSFSMQADVFLPQALAEELFLQVPSNQTRGFTAAAIDLDTPAAVTRVEDALKDEGYRTLSIGSILERVGQALAVLTVFVSGLTAIALLVAVLGIVNTVVMNVSERTREIGVLKALGATDRQVKGLFVVESGLVGLAGGIVGVVLSLLASYPGDAINQYMVQRSTQYAFHDTVFDFPPWLIGIALSFAVLLSVGAAWLPATRGSRIDPVEALRDE
jgi:putative ABC transport system permease protein